MQIQHIRFAENSGRNYRNLFIENVSYRISKKKITGFNRREIPIVYGALKIDCDLKVDILVEDESIMEPETVDEFHAVHKA